MINNKKYLSILLVFILLLSSITVYSMDESSGLPPGLEDFDIRILQNGRYRDSKILPKETKDGKILAPLRFITENSGYTVTWHPSGQIVFKNNYDEISKDIIFESSQSEFYFENIDGNILIDLDFFNSFFKDIQINYDNANKTIVIKSDYREDNNNIYHYDLGNRTIRTKLDNDLTYRLNGGIAVPEGDNNPIVFILHGAHASPKAELNRYDLGYSYLMEELAKNGYLAVSLNVGIQYSYEDGEPIESERIDDIFEETLKALIDSNNKSNNDFGLSLENKIDFNNSAFIGHSRSGQEIFNLANKYKEDNRLNLKGLLSIAPSRVYVMDYNTVDLPTSIILPELDGDVESLDGQWIFDEFTLMKDRKSEAELVYLYGANHNAFNEALLKQDEGKTWYEGELEKITPSQQREFLKKYSIDFLNTITNNKSLYKESKYKNNKIFGYKALVSNYINGERIYNADDGIKNIQTNSVDIKQVKSSYIPDENTAGLFFHPGDREDMPLLNIKWHKKNSNISFNLKDNISTKNKEILSIYMAQDSSDKFNKKKNQEFTIILKDKNNNTSSLLLDNNTPSLWYHDGHPIFDNTMFSSHTPLSILNLKLKDFKGIDTDNIKEIEFKFTENNQGSIMLKFIEFI